jgi:type IV pilus assembly protein PilV
MGFSLIEVLVTLLILLLGLLGLVALQGRAQVAETESYQRTQALVLARDMADRINANRAISLVIANTAYIVPTTGPLGTASTKDCSGPTTVADIDLCQWDAALKGAAEASGGTCNESTGANCVGAMLGARGCITDVTAGGATKKYLIEVVWQGLASSAIPPNTVICGSGSFGTEALGLRRAVTTVVQMGNLNLP